MGLHFFLFTAFEQITYLLVIFIFKEIRICTLKICTALSEAAPLRRYSDVAIAQNGFEMLLWELPSEPVYEGDRNKITLFSYHILKLSYTA